MDDGLRKALESREQDIRRGLKEAEAERETLLAQVRQLDKLIERARRSLGEEAPPSDRTSQEGYSGATVQGPRTLHEAIAIVLRERKNAPVTARELANEVNSRGLYRKKDGSPVELNQIHARVNNYKGTWFMKTGGAISLSPDRFKEFMSETGDE